MKIYLAGPSAEIERVKSAAKTLVANGHTITEMWWERVEEAARNGWKSDADVPDSFMDESAKRNERGIRRAQAMVVLCLDAGGLSSGASGELGLWRGSNEADRRRPHAIVVGSHRRHVMTWTDVQRVASIHEACGALSLWEGRTITAMLTEET